jgi:hypothetical protein
MSMKRDLLGILLYSTLPYCTRKKEKGQKKKSKAKKKRVSETRGGPRKLFDIVAFFFFFFETFYFFRDMRVCFFELDGLSLAYLLLFIIFD